MKGNIKKLTVFGMIAVIAMFIMAATALADDKAIHGEYAATTSGSCVTTPFGFTNNLTPNGPPADVFSNSFTSQTIWTFKPDGTVTVQGAQTNLSLPPNLPSASLVDVSYQLTYHVTDDSTITTDLVPGTLLSKYVTGPLTGLTLTFDKESETGKVSENHKTITLGSVTTDVAKLTFSNGLVLYGICNFSRVLIRLGE